MDERRVRKLAQGYVLFSDTERHVMPIIGKCLEGVTKAGTNVNERNVSGPYCTACIQNKPRRNVHRYMWSNEVQKNVREMGMKHKSFEMLWYCWSVFHCHNVTYCPCRTP